MGKNNKNKHKNNKQIHDPHVHDIIVSSVKPIQKMPPKDSKYPFVSVCTPTFNRRPFIPAMLKCFNHQIYPKHRMEWIIIDDGTDKIEDLVKDHPNVKYFKYDQKMTLGRKRNLLHEKSIGDILVYMDDDDYYPPERVSHAVEKLQANPSALCAGSSEIYIYFKHIQKMYQFGPYKQSHATAGTFAFKRELIQNKYDDDACLAEEKSFLKDYTVPFVQLDPLKVILVFSHEQNTFDKRKLLENPHPQYVKESTKTIDDFVKEPEMKDFYMNVDSLLENYSPGKPSMKPDVLEQIIKIEEERRKQAEKQLAQSGANQQITVQRDGEAPTVLTMTEIVGLIKQQQGQMAHLKQVCDKLIKEQIEYKVQIKSQESVINQLQLLNADLTNKLKQYGVIVDITSEKMVDSVSDQVVDIVSEQVVDISS